MTTIWISNKIGENNICWQHRTSLFNLQDHRKSKNSASAGTIWPSRGTSRTSTRHPFSYRWHIRTSSEQLQDLSGPLQEQKISICWLYLTSQDHPRDFRWNSQHPPALRKTLPFVKIGGLKNLSVCGRWQRHMEKESSNLPGTWLPGCCDFPFEVPSEPQQTPARLPGKGHCSSEVRLTNRPLTGEIFGRPMLAKGTFYINSGSHWEFHLISRKGPLESTAISECWHLSRDFLRGALQMTRYLTIIISNCLDLSRSSTRSLQRPSTHSPLLQVSPLQLHTDTTSRLFQAPRDLQQWISPIFGSCKYVLFCILFLIYFSFSLIYHQF